MPPFTSSETQAISQGIGSLSLDKHSNSGLNVKEKRELLDAEVIFADVGPHVGPLPPYAGPNVKEKREIPDAEVIFADVGPHVGPLTPYVPQDPGPCSICSGPHSFSVCALQFRCPLDAKVSKEYKVVCVCGSDDDVIDGKCGSGCSSTFGLALRKDFDLMRFLVKGEHY